MIIYDPKARTLHLLALSVLLHTGAAVRAADSERQTWCAAYATRAVQQDLLLARNPSCHVIPSLRWQSVYNNHFAGCMTFPRAFNESEDRARDAELRRCGIDVGSPLSSSPAPQPTLPVATAPPAPLPVPPAAARPASPNVGIPATVAEATAASTAVSAASAPSDSGSRPVLRTLHTFSAPDGSAPFGALVEGRDGNFYGITTRGGLIDGDQRAHYGAVFKISPSGRYATLYVFSSGPEGGTPTSLLAGADGNLYGTTRDGGTHINGTIFRLTTSGVLTTLHAFSGADGSHPRSLVRDRAGVMYGTSETAQLFRVTSAGEFSTIAVSGVNDCSGASLTFGADGFLYATCAGGGAASSGEIIKLSTSGHAVQLYSFSGPDGRFPRNGLTLGPDGNFYGATSAGGQNSVGTFFRMTPVGKLVVIRHPTLADGVDRMAAPFLVLGNGHLVGAGSSTIFDVAPDGQLTTLYKLNNFDGEGVSPNAFVQGRDGRLYATTAAGGTAGMGTLFRLAFPKSTALAGTGGRDPGPSQAPMALSALHTVGREADKFYLGGIWVVHVRLASGQIVDSQYKFFQEDDEFHSCSKENEKEVCYVGSYPARAASISLKPDFVPPANFSIDSVTVVIKDPDHVDTHVHAEGKELVFHDERLSAPEPDDAACDPENSSHTTANFAFERARAAYHHNDPVTAACWNHAAAIQGYARSQGLLGAVLEVGEGVAPDFPAAFAWARKSADQGDFLGQIVLSRLYHFGHGVPVDESKSTQWREKGMAGYRAYLQTLQGKGSSWERLSPAQRAKATRAAFAVLDTLAGISQQSAMVADYKQAHPGVSDDAARSVLGDDPDFRDASDSVSSGLTTQLKMILGVDSSDEAIRAEREWTK